MIEVNNLSFSYDYNNKKILKNISFKLFENEKLCIIGPNGSGKTTLLKCLCNILDFQGSVFINNKNIKDIEVYKSVSFLSQSSEIYFDYNVFDTVMLGRYANFKDKLLSIPSKEDKEFIFECLEKLNIIHLKDKLINRLSGGELQKVFLARAFAQNPKIILMDEPTNHLDLNSQIELIYNLKEWVNKDFRCIIAVMHDINNALNFADKILVLKDGNSKFFGYTSDFDLQLLNDIYAINVVEYMKKSLIKWM
ncbi:ABC transporter ATP-binding protein [Brachyspira aalborgi]|uniref:ABC transporter ATP-binding protein n=1 Tax=Brachyspira aalborgi TaxID=29522 RepID=A0AB38PZ78_9SPIR|nr:ABC transporter ATP-binding protein [Brachyspira aalborgi]TXJ26201.1 ABC transporter ATP-binding protein [Brachyspira aalborgi]TXJ48753.1 ABC transporter ATP-binding protein [Brachyspira aalborgi]